MDSTKAINVRYSKLATCSCSLSCGGAINYAKPQPGETCLDIGSGRGNDCIKLSEAVGAAGKVYGQDISEGMLEKARNNVADKEITNIEFIRSPLEVIPLPDKTVDIVISNCTLNHAKNKAAVWSEIFRILKPGGRFIVSDIYSLEAVPKVYADDPAAVAECWAGAITRNEYMDILLRSGFSEVAVAEESDPYDKGKIKVSSWTVRGFRPSH